MTKLDLSRLLGHVTRFRIAIENCDKSSLPLSFEQFPKGSCGDATLLLAKFLEESGYGEFNYILGKRNGSSHAWLEQGDVVVDITADQFTDMPHPAFVECGSKWHASFCGEIQNVADFDSYDERTIATLRPAYHAILKKLQRQDQKTFGQQGLERCFNERKR